MNVLLRKKIAPKLASSIKPKLLSKIGLYFSQTRPRTYKISKTLQGANIKKQINQIKAATTVVIVSTKCKT